MKHNKTLEIKRKNMRKSVRVEEIPPNPRQNLTHETTFTGQDHSISIRPGQSFSSTKRFFSLWNG